MHNQGNLIDTFGRKHDYLRISLTERCNLRCFYCMPDGIELRPKSNFMSQEEILEVASTFVKHGVKKVRFTGGEPLIRKDVAEIMQKISAMGVEIAITTNGILVHKFIDTFKASGLKNINVSLDTLQQERMAKITKREHYDQIMSNIDLLIEEGFNVKLNTVLMRDVNDDEITDFIEYTKDKNIGVRFIEFMPFGGNKWDRNKCVSSEEILKIAHNHFGKNALELLPGLTNDTSRNYRVNEFSGSFGIISSVTNPFCGGCNRMRLTADGKMRNCLFSQEETDLLTTLRSGGDIEPLIKQTVASKFEKWGGREEMKEEVESDKHPKNRSMILIGG